MKLLDLKFGESVSGKFLRSRIYGKISLLKNQTLESYLQDKIVEIYKIDDQTIGFEINTQSLNLKLNQDQDHNNQNVQDNSHLIEIELEANSPDAKKLLLELNSPYKTVIGCIMRATQKEIEINGLSFILPKLEIPVKLQVEITDEFFEQIQKRGKAWKNIKNIDDAKAWLTKEFTLENFGYWLVTSNPKGTEWEKGFCLLGQNYALELKSSGDGRLEITTFRRIKSNDYNNRIFLIRESLEFLSNTRADQLRSASISLVENEVNPQAKNWIEGWKHYNDLEGEIIEERFGQLPPLSYQGKPQFVTDETGQSKLLFNLESSANFSPWLKHLSEDGIPVKIKQNNQNIEQIIDGLVIGFEPKTCRLTIVWENYYINPPEQGTIVPTNVLEQFKLNKREKALTILENKKSELEYLKEILEGENFEGVVTRKGKKVNSKTNRKLLRSIFGNNSPTPEQEKALRIALQTPDIALIQGPPGTGKTRVIQAILALLNEGQEIGEILETVLITSLQHEAVDNAISGMNFTGFPVNRLGGKKGEDRGGELIESWRNEVIEKVKANLPETVTSTRVLIERLQGYLSQWRISTGGREGTRNILLDFRKDASNFLSVETLKMLDSLIATIPEIKTEVKPIIEDIEERAELERRLAQQCLTEDSFSEDGQRQAKRLRRFLEPYLDNLSPDVIEALELARSGDKNNHKIADICHSLKNACLVIRQQLLETPYLPLISEQETKDDEIETCLLRVIEEVKTARDSSSEGIQDSLELFIRYLEEDPNYVRNIIEKYSPIKATSCGQSDSKWLGMNDQTFTLVIVDEAARANPLDLLIPLVKGRRIILVGDHKQLPHVLEREIEQSLNKNGDETIKEIYGKSLFERLWTSLPKQTAIDGIERTVQLRDQFRMHPIIGQFVSDHFYAESPLNSSFVSPENRPNYTGAYNGKPIAWLDVPATKGGEERGGNRSWQRYPEVERIMEELRKVLPTIEKKYPKFDPTLPSGMVGVIAFYSAQEDAIKEAITNPRTGLPSHLQRRVKVGTVDAFQGREYDIVYLSTVRSNKNDTVEKRLGFTALPNRLCVAFSRARCVLIGVGDYACVASMRTGEIPWSKTLRDFVILCQKEGYVDFSN